MKKNIANNMINHSISGKDMEDFIHSILGKYFNVTRESEIKSDKFHQKHHGRKIDIKYTYGEMERFMEIDGKIHGDLENPTESTLKRNADFERIGIGYCYYNIINTESIKGIRQTLQKEGKLKSINENHLIEFLVTYIAWENYSKHLARKEAMLV